MKPCSPFWVPAVLACTYDICKSILDARTALQQLFPALCLRQACHAYPRWPASVPVPLGYHLILFQCFRLLVMCTCRDRAQRMPGLTLILLCSLLQVYEKLNTEGRFQEKLLEVYRWGKANGWDAAPPADSARQGI